MVSTYKGMLFSYKKNEILVHATIWVIFYNIMLSKWSKLDTEGQMLCDSTYMKYLEYENS